MSLILWLGLGILVLIFLIIWFFNWLYDVSQD